MYGIVKDTRDGDWWIQGDEGRVNEALMGSLSEARDYALGMVADGYDVETNRYYEDDGQGADWTNPRAISD